MTTNIVTACCFGVDSNDLRLPYLVEGRTEMLDLGLFVRSQVSRLLIGYYSGKNLFFPELRSLKLSREDRELSSNNQTFRSTMREIVLKRREKIKQGLETAEEAFDFLGILLTDEEF